MKKVLWILIVCLAILTSFVPLIYINPDPAEGFLGLKDAALLSSKVWNTFFYMHIISGGIALLIGWTQFSRNILNKRIQWHRNIGKLYVIAGLCCGFSGVFVGFYAYGGIIAQTGFVTVGCIYFYTTLMAYLHIKNKNIAAHQAMMIYSYAACLAAITLRLYSPFLTMWLGDYTLAYRAVAWLSWVPNLLIANRMLANGMIKPYVVTGSQQPISD